MFFSRFKLHLNLGFVWFYAAPLFLVTAVSEATVGVHSGIGFSTASSGRAVPALDLGYAIDKNILLSGMTTGAATPAYYYNEYSVSGFWWEEFLQNYWGRFFYAPKICNIRTYFSEIDHYDVLL